jgi:glycosyltransferase involved in cell wall biosynthesis
MKVALIAPPFITVPPERYGGTELFVANLAEGLADAGHEAVVYAVRRSTVKCEVRGWYDEPQWPPDANEPARFRNHVHTARAIRDAIADGFDIIHVQDAVAVPLSLFASAPMVYTLHHPHEPELTQLYQQFPQISFVAISRFQQAREPLARIRTVYHGIRAESFAVVPRKQPYLSFLGRIAPVKGVHVAIDVAKACGIPLKIGGEIQPLFRDYWERCVRPHVDGKFIEYVGEVDHRHKQELLANSLAFLFPIQWNEPFGLVMIEAMACGTPVLALRGGAVEEVVANGISGWVCDSAAELAEKASAPAISPNECRRYMEQRFSLSRMVCEYVRLYRDLLTA